MAGPSRRARQGPRSGAACAHALLTLGPRPHPFPASLPNVGRSSESPVPGRGAGEDDLRAPALVDSVHWSRRDAFTRQQGGARCLAAGMALSRTSFWGSHTAPQMRVVRTRLPERAPSHGCLQDPERMSPGFQQGTHPHRRLHGLQTRPSWFPAPLQRGPEHSGSRGDAPRPWAPRAGYQQAHSVNRSDRKR